MPNERKNKLKKTRRFSCSAGNDRFFPHYVHRNQANGVDGGPPIVVYVILSCTENVSFDRRRIIFRRNGSFPVADQGFNFGGGGAHTNLNFF